MSDPQSQPQRYRLLAELGHGGMADVYLAVLKGPTDFTKLAVVKRLRTHLAEDPEFLAMFLQEARIAARLNHPNVVHTFEVGNDGKHHFIAMEYLQGHAYSALLARIGRDKVDIALQLRVLIEILDGLQYAHDLRDFDGTPLGLVHRDVSPQNIIVTYDGQIKLLDFGIAKALDSAVETRTGVIKGKLSYMSPEQAVAGDIDRRSDVYSVGVILWEAIAAKRRWKGLSNVQTMKKLVGRDEPDEFPDPERRGLPRELSFVMRKSLARDPDARYRDAAEMRADLENILELMGRRVHVRDVGKQTAEAFASDRERIQGVIEQELKKLQTREAQTERPPATADLELQLIEVPNTTPPSSLNSYNQAAVISAPVQEPLPAEAAVPKKKHREPARGRWFYVAALLAAGVVVATVGRSRLQDSAAPAASPVGEPAPQHEVRLALAAYPPQAEIYVDDQRLGGNPHVLTMPRASRLVTIRAELSGYETESRQVSLDNDIDVRFELEATAPVPAVSATADDSKRASARWNRRHHTAAPTRPIEPTGSTAGAEPPPAPESKESVNKPLPKRPSVTLDTGNPWKR